MCFKFDGSDSRMKPEVVTNTTSSREGNKVVDISTNGGKVETT